MNQRPSYRGGRGSFRGNPSSFRSTVSRGRSTAPTSQDFVIIDRNSMRWPNPKEVIPVQTSTENDYSESLRILGGYSVDSDGSFSFDKSNLMFLKPEFMPNECTKKMQVHLDLNEGIEKIEKYSGSSENGLKNLLSWIISNKKEFLAEVKTKRSAGQYGNIVLEKNVFKALCKIPYDFKEDLTFRAMSKNGIIFIVKYVNMTEENLGISEENSLRVKNFRKILSTESSARNVSCNENYRVVFSGSLNGHHIFYSGSVDCVQSDLYDENLEDSSAFVGLGLYSKKRSFGFKMWTAKNMFFNSLFLKSDNAICGVKNGDIVTELKFYNRQDVKELGQGFWHPETCFAFASKLMSFIKKKCTEVPEQVLKFEKGSFSSKITCAIDEETPSLVPNWFFEELLADDDLN